MEDVRHRTGRRKSVEKSILHSTGDHGADRVQSIKGMKYLRTQLRLYAVRLTKLVMNMIAA